MIKILASNGYTRTQTIDKIISDHQHLKGFSRATIYRKLPDNMKRKYERSNIIMLPDYSDVSNETFDEGEEETEIDDTTTNEIRFTTEDVTDERFKPEYHHNVPKSTVHFDSKVLDLFAEQEKQSMQQQQPTQEPAVEEPTQQQEHENDNDNQTTEIFDKDFVNRLVQENKQLQDENYNLKVLVGATEEQKAYNRSSRTSKIEVKDTPLSTKNNLLKFMIKRYIIMST